MREKRSSKVRIPQLVSIKQAVYIYYTRLELSNDDIRKMFGTLCGSTIAKLKDMARRKSFDNGTIVWNSSCVNTVDAFAAWGLSIADLEHRLNKLEELQVSDLGGQDSADL